MEEAFSISYKWWEGCPELISRDLWLSIVRKPLPNDADASDREKWATICQQDSKADPIDFVVVTVDYAYLRSVQSGNRFHELNELYEKFPNNICFILLLAECYYHMMDSATSLRLFKEARELLHQDGIEDAALDTTIEHVSVLFRMDLICEEEEDPDLKICEYSRPSTWVPSTMPSNLVALQIRWAKLQEECDGAKQFARYACVMSNELEGVFELKADSSKKLARCGLYKASIVGISSRSRHKNPEKILSIIQNMEKCYHSVRKVVEGDMEFTEEFLKSMHRQLLDRDNIDISYDPDDRIYRAFVTSMGQFREIPCHAGHENQGYETRFCPPSEISTEMNFFFQQVQQVLGSKDMDPFRAAAYLQHTLLRIHPFGDGNGRVSRLISSIPLLKEHLPPVIVRMESKQQYFNALKIADDSGDIDVLAAFLQDECFSAIEDLIAYDPNGSPPCIVYGRPLSRRKALEKACREQEENEE